MLVNKNKTTQANSMNFAGKSKNSSFVSAKIQRAKSYFSNLTAKQYSAVLFLVIALGGVLAYWIQHPSRKEKAATVAYEQNDIPGWWMQQYFFKSLCSEDNCKAGADPDKDGLTNDQEYFYHSDPLNANTAKDSLNDGDMVAAGYDPSRPGRIKFDDIITDENILGEGILYDQDLKDMLAEQQDISKVAIPLPDRDSLNVDYSTDAESYKRYIEKINRLSEKYFPKSESVSFTDTLKNGGGPGVDDMVARAKQMASELRATSVPMKFLTFHQYSIAFYELFSQVLYPPDMSVIDDISNRGVDEWYDKAQAFIAIQQKLAFEKQILATQDVTE